jgi:hypothetical protein
MFVSGSGCDATCDRDKRVIYRDRVQPYGLVETDFFNKNKETPSIARAVGTGRSVLLLGVAECRSVGGVTAPPHIRTTTIPRCTSSPMQCNAPFSRPSGGTNVR